MNRIQSETPNGVNTSELEARTVQVEGERAKLVKRLGLVPASALADVTKHMDALAAERDGLVQALEEPAKMNARRFDRDALRKAQQDAAALRGALELASAHEFNAPMRRAFPNGLVMWRQRVSIQPLGQVQAKMRAAGSRLREA